MYFSLLFSVSLANTQFQKVKYRLSLHPENSFFGLQLRRKFLPTYFPSEFRSVSSLGLLPHVWATKAQPVIKLVQTICSTKRDRIWYVRWRKSALSYLHAGKFVVVHFNKPQKDHPAKVFMWPWKSSEMYWWPGPWERSVAPFSRHNGLDAQRDWSTLLWDKGDGTRHWVEYLFTCVFVNIMEVMGGYFWFFVLFFFC